MIIVIMVMMITVKYWDLGPKLWTLSNNPVKVIVRVGEQSKFGF